MFEFAKRLSEGTLTVNVPFRFILLSLVAVVLSQWRANAQAPVEIITQPVQPPIPLTLGSSLRLTVGVKGELPLSFQWQRNGVNLRGETFQTLSVQKFTPEQGGSYSVLVGNKVASLRSRSVRLVPELARLPFTDAMDPRQFDDRDFPNRIKGLAGNGIGDNAKATVHRDLGEPLHAGIYGGASMWLVWSPGTNGIATLSTRGSGFDTLLAVYVQKDPRSPLSYRNLTPVESNDDAEPFKTSQVTFNALSNATYFIAVDGDGSSSRTDSDRSAVQRGDIVFSWDIEPTAQKLPTFLSFPSDFNLSLGTQLRINGTVDAGSADSTSFQWYFKGLPLTGAVDPQLLLSRVTRNNVGRYYCQASAKFGLLSRSVVSRVVDVQIYRRSNNSDAHVLAQDKFSTAADYKFSQFEQNVGAAGRGAAKASVGVVRPLGLSRGTSGTQIFDTVGAGKDEGEPDHCGESGGASEWYAFLADTDGVVVADTGGSDIDTVLAAYYDSGSGTGLYDGLVNVGCNNDSPGLGKQSRVSFQCVAGRVYYLAVDGVGGASGIVHLNYLMVNPLTIVQSPTSVVAGLGATVNLGVVALGAGDLAYQWRRNGVDVPGATSDSHTITNLQPQTAGTYTVLVRDDLTNQVSLPAVVSISSPPQIQTHPASVTVNTGALAEFSVVASGAGVLSYQWRKQGVVLEGKTMSSLSLPNVVPDLEGGYSVVVSNGSGAVTSQVATLVVRVPPKFLSEPADLAVVPGAPAIFTSQASGKPAPQYQWYRGPQTVVGATTSTHSIGAVQSQDLAGYSVVASNAAGSVTSRVAQLTFVAGPPPELVVEPNGTGPVKITVVGAVGYAYVLERSTNFVKWSPVRTNANGGFQYAETPGAAPTVRWFRAFRK